MKKVILSFFRNWMFLQSRAYMYLRCVVVGLLVCLLPAYAQSSSAATSQKMKSPSKDDARFHVYIDDPSFRPIRLMMPTRILYHANQQNIPQLQKQKYLVSLKKFATYLRSYLELTAIFQVYELSYYGAPFFPWPSELQSLENWAKSKPNISVNSGKQDLDMVILVQIENAESENPRFVLQLVDTRVGRVSYSVSYPWMKREKSTAMEFADALLTHITGAQGIFSSRIVFIGKRTAKSHNQVYTVRIDGSDLRRITSGEYIHLSPAWSSDGKKILFTSYQSGGPDLYAYDLSSNRTQKISAGSGIDIGGQQDPLSSTVVFSGSDGGDSNIYAVQIDGKKRRPLIMGDGIDVEPTFSPNGRMLAFVSGRFGNPHIFLAHLDRSRSRLRVTKDQRLTWAGWYNANPAFSPDSQKIAFAGYDREIDRFDIFMMDVDGKHLERLTLKTADNESPSWSPHGQLLVFHSNRVGNSNVKRVPALYLMRRDGSGQRKIALPLYSAQSPKWGPAMK